MIFVLFFAPWVLLAVLYLSGRLKQVGSAIKETNTPVITIGPWGMLEVYELVTEPPRDFIKLDLFPLLDEQWLFKGLSRDQLAVFLDGAELPRATRDALLATAVNDPDTGWKIRPADALILNLTPNSRHIIYSELAKFQENVRQYDPFVFNPAKLNKWIVESALRAETKKLLCSLIYPRGNRVLLADIVPLLRGIPDDAEKYILLDLLLRRTSYLLKLRVPADADLKAMTEYWGAYGRKDDVEPLFRSLSGLTTGNSSGIGILLPAFAKQRLHIYPPETHDPALRHRDCHWTTLNFFNDTPDDRFSDGEIVRQTLASEYQTVQSELRLGDVALMQTPEGKVVHSCVYIAGDYYFTKNGPSHISPWIFERLNDIKESFPGYEKLAVVHYRLKKYAGQ